MKKNQPLRISISEPCKQDWNSMQDSNKGRYCEQCSKTVLDFSAMTNAELIQFFKTKPLNVCGRFRTEQLDRDVVSLQPRRTISGLYQKMAAAVLAILSFRLSTAQAQKQTTTSTTTQSPVSRLGSLPDTVVLTGKVMNNFSKPVANAKVNFDGLIETYTDAEGKFQLQFGPEITGNHNLYISAAGLKRAVRNFSRSMGSTEYSVMLESPDECKYIGYTMGAPIWGADPILHDFPSIKFTQNETVLNSESKLLLETLANHLRTEPHVIIKLVAYGIGMTGTKGQPKKQS